MISTLQFITCCLITQQPKIDEVTARCELRCAVNVGGKPTLLADTRGLDSPQGLQVKYSGVCLAALGIVGKVGGVKAGNALVGKAGAAAATSAETAQGWAKSALGEIVDFAEICKHPVTAVALAPIAVQHCLKNVSAMRMRLRYIEHQIFINGGLLILAALAVVVSFLIIKRFRDQVNP